MPVPSGEGSLQSLSLCQSFSGALGESHGKECCLCLKGNWVSQVDTVKDPPANAGDAGDLSSVPGSGRSLEGGHATHSSILTWKISWTEEPGGLQSMGSQKSQTRQHSLTSTKESQF